MLDAGDTIQGTPLAYYYAKIEPITDGGMHPMANAMNLIGYDAAALGNHEFNYGIPLLRTFESQLDFPLLGANAVDPATGLPVFTPYIIKTFRMPQGPDLKVGILGLTNPGIAIWDNANVSGKIEFPGLVEQAKIYVPKLKKLGCDLVDRVAPTPGPTPRRRTATRCPTRRTPRRWSPSRCPTSTRSWSATRTSTSRRGSSRTRRPGSGVLLCEPDYWGMRLAVMELHLVRHGDGWRVLRAALADAELQHGRQDHQVASGGARPAPRGDRLRQLGDRVPRPRRCWPRGRRSRTSRSSTSSTTCRPTPSSRGSPAPTRRCPVLSIAAPFNRQASFPSGQVTVRDVAGLYIYDNTLLGVKVTGQQVKDYLEYSMQYFKQVSGTGPFTMDQVTNAVTPNAPHGRSRTTTSTPSPASTRR